MKLIVAGTRTFTNYELLKRVLGAVASEPVEVVCGEAKGADALGKRYAVENDLTVHSFPADWNTYGKSAGYKRNAEMAAFADACVVFWDGVSKGTKHMMDLAERHGLRLLVVRYDLVEAESSVGNG